MGILVLSSVPVVVASLLPCLLLPRVFLFVNEPTITASIFLLMYVRVVKPCWTYCVVLGLETQCLYYTLYMSFMR